VSFFSRSPPSPLPPAPTNQAPGHPITGDLATMAAGLPCPCHARSPEEGEGRFAHDPL
jgi:hypothetical protein